MAKRKSKRTESEKRHYNMTRIKSTDTKSEIALRKALWHRGIRYRKNYALLPGKPDIAITKHKIAIFCDGEFWHGKDWGEKKNHIHSNREYWLPKIERNMKRDNEINKQLDFFGWTVLRFWDQEIRKQLISCIECIEEAIFQTEINEHSNQFYNIDTEEADYITQSQENEKYT